MASFYEGDGDQGMDLGAPPAPGASDPAPPAASGGQTGAGTLAGKVNLMGGGGEDDSDSEGEDGQAFFAGGSTNSGTNVSLLLRRFYFIKQFTDTWSQEEEDKQCGGLFQSLQRGRSRSCGPE